MSSKFAKSSESVSSAKPLEVVKPSRVKRTFTAQFKEEAVAMISREGLSVAEAARRLGVHENLLRKWRGLVQSQGVKSLAGPAQPSAIEEENRQLREENARLRMERDILKNIHPARRDLPGQKHGLTPGLTHEIAG